MTFQNSINSSNVHFQNTSGTLEVADRLRVSTTGSTFNLGITLAAGTFTITGAGGTALSATNPAYVILQDRSSPGLNRIFTVIANQTFIDDAGASTIIGNLFGLTTSIAYAQDMPFFLYAVSNDAEDTVSFMVSRIPHRKVAPAAGNIGKTGSAVADTQGSFFALGDPTVGDYDANPCTCIGSFRMRMSAADDWTVQALVANDGIGQFNEGTQFLMATGQFGAAAGSYFTSNGGTAPIWTTQNPYWSIAKNGQMLFTTRFETNSTAGVGAVTAQLCIPFANAIVGGNCGTFSMTTILGTSIPIAGNIITFTAIALGYFNTLLNQDIATRDMEIGININASIG